MSSIQNTSRIKELKEIFYVQLGLIVLMSLLAMLDSFVASINLGSFFFALTMGAFGASISLLRRVMEGKNMFDFISRETKILGTLIPILNGTILGGIAYLLFVSGILSGTEGNGLLSTNLFPDFIKRDSLICSEADNLLLEFRCLKPSNIDDAGKLMVWCFIAGFSERLVVGILQNLESKGKVN